MLDYDIDDQQVKNHKKNNMNFINDKIGNILPELMARNIKLGDRLKTKLKVSNFLNNAENRNQKYLKSFVLYSDKRVKDLKTGLELLKAIKQSSKNISPLCSQISGDIILKNSDFLIKEKKLLNENTEQETHLKINDLIHNLKNTLKNINNIPNKPIKKPIKSLSETELHNIKSILNNKIKKEKNMINNKIQKYLEKLNNTAETDRKEFRYFIDHLDISDNLKFINYSKPKPFKIKDKECSSMAKIKKQIFPYLGSSKKNKFIKKKYININNISNRNTELNVNISNEINNFSSNDNGKSEIIEKDTLKVINNLAEQGIYLPLKISKSVNRVNSLIDINLPTPKAYEQTIKETKKHSSLLTTNQNTENEFKKVDGNINDIIKILNEQDPNLLSKNKLKKIINIFKKEIDSIKTHKINFDKKKEEDIKEKYSLINSLKTHLTRIKKYNNSNNINEKKQNISENLLFKKKMQKNNVNNELESNIFPTSNNNSSFSTEKKNNDKNRLNNKLKLMKNKSFNNYYYDTNFDSFQNSFSTNKTKKIYK